jgi:hypothetical protein
LLRVSTDPEAEMSRYFSPLAAFLLTVLALGTAGVRAEDAPVDPPVPARNAHANLPESVRRVERETGGEVLRAEPMQRDGREVYRLKVLTADGRVRVVQDDPNAVRDRRSVDRQDSSRPANRKEKQSSRDSDAVPPQY